MSRRQLCRGFGCSNCRGGSIIQAKRRSCKVKDAKGDEGGDLFANLLHLQPAAQPDVCACLWVDGLRLRGLLRSSNLVVLGFGMKFILPGILIRGRIPQTGIAKTRSLLLITYIYIHLRTHIYIPYFNMMVSIFASSIPT